jgi:hypothetical protein
MNDRTPEPPAEDGQRPSALLITGPPGWTSGPMPDAIPELTAADLAAAVGHRGWEVTDHGDHLTAEHRTGSALRVLTAHTAAGLAAKIANAEAAGPAEDPEVTLTEIAALHPTWAVDADQRGHGVEAVRGDVHLWAYNAAELAALLDLADPMVP